MEMQKGYEKLGLKTDSGKKFWVDFDSLDNLKRELEDFLEDENYMNTELFAKKVLFTQELKANNSIEGINYDITLIEEVIKNAKLGSDLQNRLTIVNLYNGYNYILKRLEINESTVAQLYKILSRGLLSEDYINKMGKLYREGPVYILKNGRIDSSMDEGILPLDVKEYMDCFFDYVNNGDTFVNSTDYFIKSQIMHFYFVYVHPYFDINGRTSRTVAMWYLFKNNLYPYTIFNRGINFDSTYDKTIRFCKANYDLTNFLKYMLLNLKKELEKEYIMHNLSRMALREWGGIDYQTVEYFLFMNGREKNVMNFAKVYNWFNDKKRVKEIYETMILPLIIDGTFIIKRETSTYMFGTTKNIVIELNPDRVSQIDVHKLTKVNL